MLSCLKCFSSIGAIIMLIVGLAFSAITVYAYLNQDLFLTDEAIKQKILNAMIIISSVVVGASINGIIGVVRKNCCMIFVYQLFLVIFLALFAGIGIGCTILPDRVFDGDCKTSKNPLIESAFTIYEKSDTYFCKSECPCAMTSEGFSKYVNQADLDNLKTNYSFNLTTGVTATYKCDLFKNWTSNLPINIGDTIGAIEKYLQCSDWCPERESQNLLYRFWDINQGKPTRTCYNAVHDAFYYYSNVIGISSFSIASILFFVCITNICLCCHPNKKNLQFRDRFIYVSQRQSPRKQKYTRIR